MLGLRSLLPFCSLFPVPCSLFPVPYSPLGRIRFLRFMRFLRFVRKIRKNFLAFDCARGFDSGVLDQSREGHRATTISVLAAASQDSALLHQGLLRSLSTVGGRSFSVAALTDT